MLRSASANLCAPAAASDDEPILLGEGPEIAQLRIDIDTAARSDAKVLISGETGAGKEVVARLVHRTSRRRHHPFVAINCAGLPDSLLESELFGHVRGSFTGAYRDKPGLAALADRGTLFLDELGEMSARMQAVLLRFAETREIHRLGSDRLEGRVDVRIVAATNRNLVERIATGDFREDLYYRLNVVHITLPPLRERGGDIPLLFDHFLAYYCRVHDIDVPELTQGAKDLLMGYRWPGNVRELKNVVERVVVRHLNGPIRPDELPSEVRAGQASREGSACGQCGSRVGTAGALVSGSLDPTALGVGPRRREESGARALMNTGHAGPVAHPPAMLSVAPRPAADAAWNEMMVNGKSFWMAVHPLFIERELTKSDVRDVIRRGLEQTQGSYRKLTELFHMPPGDYKRFLAFLYQHDCHLAFHPFREARAAEPSALAASGR